MKRLWPILLAFVGIVYGFTQSENIPFKRERGAKYLIICYDRYYKTVQRLAQWKQKKGILTKVVKISEIGDNKPNVIKDYISDAYNSWEIIPEYVLIVGDINNIAPYPHPLVGASDNPYVDVNNDTLLELKIGRLPCHNKRQLYVMINKIFNYERKPYLGDTMFYKRAMTIRQDPGPYHNTGVEFVRGMILANSDFVQVDTLYNPMHNKFDVQDSLKAGRSYVFYTGHGAGTHWPSPFNVNPYLNNKMKTPVIFSWSCQTVLQKNYLGQKWLKSGSPRYPKGAVAYIGTTTSGLYARYRNFVARNFIRSIFEEKAKDVGTALGVGLDSLWTYTPDSFGHVLYSEFNLLGDPTMNLWTAVPRPMRVTHDSIVTNTLQSYNMSLVNAAGEGIARAQVCLSASDNEDFYYIGDTDSAGLVSFEIDPVGLDSFWITASAPNQIAYEATCQVLTDDRFALTADRFKAPDLFTLSPNPAKSFFTIRLSLFAEYPQVKIFDVTGKSVKEIGGSGVKEYRVDLQGIKPGVYFVHIKTGKISETKRLTILR